MCLIRKIHCRKALPWYEVVSFSFWSVAPFLCARKSCRRCFDFHKRVHDDATERGCWVGFVVGQRKKLRTRSPRQRFLSALLCRNLDVWKSGGSGCHFCVGKFGEKQNVRFPFSFGSRRPVFVYVWRLYCVISSMGIVSRFPQVISWFLSPKHYKITLFCSKCTEKISAVSLMVSEHGISVCFRFVTWGDLHQKQTFTIHDIRVWLKSQAFPAGKKIFLIYSFL